MEDMVKHHSSAGLPRALSEVQAAVQWAKSQGMENVATRLEYAARLIKEFLNKMEKPE